MNNIIGINEQNLKKLILEIYDYRDKMSKIFDSMQTLIFNTKDYYIGQDGDALRSEFAKISSNFDTVLNNVKSYGSDLEFVLSSYKENSVKRLETLKK